jgi:mediator of RNA polymerase II transcription subunit 14
VTFQVADEFELDLSIADEDPASQFFFIDFRFMFSPCARELPEGRLRDEIEVKTNDVLKREGLAGCYNFLHDLVLTHKIHILTSQAFELARGRWSDNLLVEKVRRSVSVQYWPNKSGGKNWIEISIIRGKAEKRLFSIGSQTPQIALRWHRGGKEVLDPDVWLDSANLSMESILKQIIALHTNYIFRETKRKLRESPIYLKKALFVKHKAHAMEPTASSLRIQLSCSDVIEMVQEPISGNFVLVPPSNLHARVERDLSMLRDPAVEIVSRIATLRCISAVELTEQRTRLMRWQTWKTHIPNQETIKKLFGPGIMRLVLFKVPSWDPKWLLAFTASMAGDSWWVVQMKEAKNDTGSVDAFRGPDDPFQAAYKISCTASDEGLLVNPTYSALSNIENTAAAIIAHKVDVQELEKFPVHHKQQKSTEPLEKVIVPDFYIHYIPAKVPSLRKAPGTYRRWCGEMIKLSFKGLSRSRTSVISIVTGRLLTPIPNVDNLTSNMGSSLAFHPTSGIFWFRLSTPVCQSSIPAILDRFQQIERLVRFLETSRRCELRCESVSLNNLTFTYATDSNANPLKSTITFATDTPMQISFPEHDPHIRIQDFLATMLNTPKGFEHTAMILRQTLPLMRAFVTIETLERDPGSSLHILPHSATAFRVIYQNPNMAYEIRQRQRKAQTYWYLTACRSHAENGTSNLYGRTWHQICQEKGPGWHGMNGGVVSELEAVEGLILRLDQLVRERIPDNVNDEKQEQEEGQSNARDAIKKGPEREVITLD